MDQLELKEFKMTVTFIKIFAIILMVLVFLLSYYSFLFFIIAMIPTFVALFFDKEDNRCASATVCTFNLIGVVPYLYQMYNSTNVSFVSKLMISNIETWFVIYFFAFIGQIFVWFVPEIVTVIYVSKAKMNVETLKKQRKVLADEWNISENDES